MKTFLFLATLCLPVSLVLAEPDIQVTPLAVDFDHVDIGLSRTATVTIKNVGDSAIAIETIELQQAGTDFAITAAPYTPTFFGPGGYVEVEVTFTPSNDGTATAILRIESSDPDTPVTDINLTGIGIDSGGGEETPAEQAQETIDFLDTSVAQGTITGNGSGKSAPNRLKAFTNMLLNAQSLIEAENYEEALAQLKSAQKHSDGQDKPKDFITGQALPELDQLIFELIEMLQSES